MPSLSKSKHIRIAALIVAAGSGKRLGGDVPKQYQLLAGRPVLRHTIDIFLAHPEISHVQVVIAPNDAETYARMTKGLELTDPTFGGSNRQRSVLNGLRALQALDPGDATQLPSHVLIHDGARPFATAQLIDRVIHRLRDEAEPVAGAVAALAVVDSLQKSHNGLVEGAVDREDLFRAQTPQGFRFDAILDAHERHAGQDFGDDVALARAAGLDVALVRGSEDNFKITLPSDLHRAEAMLFQRLPDLRCGQGFDVHRFSEGDGVTLCGLRIPHHKALQGHSDADVALHALTDAILGALGAGDIGQHFPPGDPRWRDAPSEIFLRHARDLVTQRGGVIAHLDVTIICEAPKIGPHREAMITRLSDLLDLPRDRVSVKATTTEELGFTGRREGIAAQAIATLRLPMPPLPMAPFDVAD